MKTQAAKIFSWLALAAAVLFGVAACGGGGGGDDDNFVGVSIEGAYAGPLAGDPGGRNVFNLLVLENNEIWGLYATDLGGGVLGVSGFIQGNGATGAGSTFTAANSVSFFGSDTGVASPLTGTYNSSTVTGTITTVPSAATRTFSAGDVPPATYNYNAAASLSTVSGTFAGLQDLTGKNVTLNVVGGTFSGTIAGGCTFSGTIFPRPSGRNVFNINLTFDAMPACDFPSTAFTGVAISLTLPGPTQELLLTAVNGARSRGIAFIGTR